MLPLLLAEPVVQFIGISLGIGVIAASDKAGEEAGKGIGRQVGTVALIAAATYIAFKVLKKKGAV